MVSDLNGFVGRLGGRIGLDYGIMDSYRRT